MVTFDLSSVALPSPIVATRCGANSTGNFACVCCVGADASEAIEMRVAVFFAVAVVLCAFAAVSVDAQRVLPAGESPHSIPTTRHAAEEAKAKAKAQTPATNGARGIARAKCPAETQRQSYCRGVAKVPKGKWAVSQSAPWAKAYLKCLSQCATQDVAAAPPKTPQTRDAFRNHFKTAYRAAKPTKTPVKPAVKPTAAKALPKKSLLELKGKAQGKALAAGGSAGASAGASATGSEFDPTKPIQDLLVTVLRGVDLAEQILDGKGKQIWEALRCPACQVAVLKLYQKGCGALANAVCEGVSGVACGQFASACNAVICPAIDPLFSGECLNIISAIQKFPEFRATVPYQVCTTIHMCFAGDENFGEGMD